MLKFFKQSVTACVVSLSLVLGALSSTMGDRSTYIQDLLSDQDVNFVMLGDRVYVLTMSDYSKVCLLVDRFAITVWYKDKELSCAA